MTKKSVARFLFYGGLLLAYLPPVLVPRTLSLAPFAYTVLGLLVAAAAATALAFGTPHRRIAGTGLGYA
ncbi:hypothetical protein [Hymenobacter sp. B1770]|uniref:hypothetical protein n=1 Tax=Hymenobacter sp. B1770 TaxID=1718788 RepID=UPI003CFA6D25